MTPRLLAHQGNTQLLCTTDQWISGAGRSRLSVEKDGASYIDGPGGMAEVVSWIAHWTARIATGGKASGGTTVQVAGYGFDYTVVKSSKDYTCEPPAAPRGTQRQRATACTPARSPMTWHAGAPRLLPQPRVLPSP